MIGVLCLGVFLSACASFQPETTKGYEQMLETWIGAPEDRLIAQWGIPTSLYETGEHKYLKFHRNYGWSQYGEWYCDVTMTITNDVVTNLAWRGNACKAKEKSK